ncbi:het domain-containing protein [Fusarium sporotrichioides]|uniref:Het domain-containing protein n=1 Tax=Fusarium sporotrichioides TaxID=5514 RepID=A0A395RFS8_FUSSP|nr:het domain-containing protein [Fusarium sporotrichioides]
MWLLATDTLDFIHVMNPENYKFAILSHTWGDEEVSYQDMSDLARARRKKGFQKIEKTCEIARNRGLQYTWIDTCCIDKTSSAELSEAINSMYRWYQLSEVCFTYLSDFQDDITVMTNDFGKCRWFSRGWTLQELIAPRTAEFYSCTWQLIGDKISMASLLASAADIDTKVLLGETRLSKIPVAVKMSWAAKRKTTRVEDAAYCLLGIFDINMPMLYGEGHKAFYRLQQMILQETHDLSLFAWRQDPTSTRRYRGIFADAPAEFSDTFKDFEKDSRPRIHDTVLTSRGLEIETIIGTLANKSALVIPLTQLPNPQAIQIQRIGTSFVRSCPETIHNFECSVERRVKRIHIKTLISPDEDEELLNKQHPGVRLEFVLPKEWFKRVIDCGPSWAWDSYEECFVTQFRNQYVGYVEFAIANYKFSPPLETNFLALFCHHRHRWPNATEDPLEITLASGGWVDKIKSWLLEKRNEIESTMLSPHDLYLFEDSPFSRQYHVERASMNENRMLGWFPDYGRYPDYGSSNTPAQTPIDNTKSEISVTWRDGGNLEDHKLIIEVVQEEMGLLESMGNSLMRRYTVYV